MSKLKVFNTVELVPAPLHSKMTIKNLARFYVYELSKYKTVNLDSNLPEDRLYEAVEDCFEFEKYWSDPNYFPFIIRVDNDLAGFALVNKNGSSKEIDWYLSEFFIVAQFQRKGVGREIAFKLFNQFKGHWELMEFPENLPAIKFWRTILNDYTKGNYLEMRQMISTPKPQEMIIQRFQN